MKNNVLLGTVQLLSSDGTNLAHGRGVFLKDSNIMHISVKAPEILKTIDDYWVFFKDSSSGECYMSINSYRQLVVTMHNVETDLYFYDYVEELDNKNDAIRLLKNGISGAHIELSGIYRSNTEVKRMSVVSQEYAECTDEFPSAGKKDLFLVKQFSGFRVEMDDDFRVVKPYLDIQIELVDPISLFRYKDLIECIELYWCLYNFDINFNIINCYIALSNKRFKIHLRKNSFFEIRDRRTFQVDKGIGNLYPLCRIVECYLDDKNKLIKYGFSKYMELQRVRTIDHSAAILYMAAAVDSITAYISREGKSKMSKHKKMQLKNGVQRIRDMINSSKAVLPDEIVDFYCNSDIGDVINAITKSSFKKNIYDTCKNLDIKLKSDCVKQAIVNNEMRNKIIHGQQYDIKTIWDGLEDRAVVYEDTSNNKTSYILSTQRGYLRGAADFVTLVGHKYFCR